MKPEEETEDDLAEVVMIEAECRKRSRFEESGSTTPTLVPATARSFDSDDEFSHPIKRFRSDCRTLYVKPVKKVVSPISRLPEDLLANCLGYLGTTEDRFALQCTSKQFQRLSNSSDMLKSIQVGGDKTTGLNGIIQETDTVESASMALAPYVEAGNCEAIYM